MNWLERNFHGIAGGFCAGLLVAAAIFGPRNFLWLLGGLAGIPFGMWAWAVFGPYRGARSR